MLNVVKYDLHIADDSDCKRFMRRSLNVCNTENENNL